MWLIALLMACSSPSKAVPSFSLRDICPLRGGFSGQVQAAPICEGVTLASVKMLISFGSLDISRWRMRWDLVSARGCGIGLLIWLSMLSDIDQGARGMGSSTGGGASVHPMP